MIALNKFSMLLKTRKQRLFGLRYAETMVQAGKDLEITEIQDWGDQLLNGLHSYNNGNFEGIEKLLTLLISNPNIETPQKSVAIGLRGEVYRFLGRYDDAINNLDQAIDIDPNDFYSIADRAETWRLKGDYKNALQDFNRAIELNPKYAWAIAGRGVVYYRLQQNSEALADLNNAIEIDPKNFYSIRDRGAINADLKNYQAAIEDFSRAIEIDSSDDWIFFGRGICYLKIEDYKKAYTDFNKLVEIQKSSSEYSAYYFRALSLMALGHREEANNNLEHAVSLAQIAHGESQTDGHHTLNVGLCYLALGDFEKAKHFYRVGLARGVSESRIWVSIDDLDDFLVICPHSKEARIIKKVLKKRVAIDEKNV